MNETPRDRLREMLDAVLDPDNRTLDDMAGDAYLSPHHFSRLLSGGAGEAPVAMRRRVMLERAAWELRHGTSVTEAAWAAGYESVEGFSRAFSRAFGHPPSVRASSHWLTAPNGIHFHPPASLWVSETDHAMDPVTEHLVLHDLDDTRYLIDAAASLSPGEFSRSRIRGAQILEWDGPEESLAAVLSNHVRSKEVWLASIRGDVAPPEPDRRDAASIARRHETAAPEWVATVRDINRRGAWNDRLIDALCEPPQSFVIGSVVAHVLTFAAGRRQAARLMLRDAGVTVDDGDPIAWHRAAYDN